MPGQGPFTKPPPTAQNMLCQMGLVQPSTTSIGTNPLDQFCREDSCQIVEQMGGQALCLGQAPGVEKPYGHFSNNCNFFIYRVQGQGMTHSLDPNAVASDPYSQDNNGVDQTGWNEAAHNQQAAFRPPNFYRPSPFPVPRAAEILSMLRPFKRFSGFQ
jgi:hypothetical protein